MSLIIVITNILSILTWTFPLALLTLIAHNIETYTKFRTRWKFFLIATVIALTNPLISIIHYQRNHTLLMEYYPLMVIILLGSPVLGVYAALDLLRFQRITLGKTKPTCLFFGALGVIIPVIGYLYTGLKFEMTVSLILQNVIVVSLIFMYMTIGKIARTYLPRYGSVTYTASRIGAITLLVCPFLQNYAYIFNHGAWNKLFPVGIFSHLFSSLLLGFAAILLIEEARTRGLHLVPVTERVKKIPKRYRLKKGHGYLVKEGTPRESFDIFIDLATHGHYGLCITRVNPQEIREKFGLRTTPILWLTNVKTDEKSIKPTELDRLLLVVKDFMSFGSDSVILLQRLDYLITQNNFRKVLRFIQSLNDMIMGSNCVSVVSVDSSTLSGEELALLTQELHDLGGVDTLTLPESLYEILHCIYNENKLNKTPSFTEISRKFSITKTTTRGRIQELEEKGLLRVIRDGKYKLLEITERGKNLMLSPIGPKGGE